MKNNFELNDNHIDVLQEISNIGSGNALTSLSKLVDKKIVMSPPSARFVNFGNASDFLGGAEQVMLAVLVNVHSSNINGIMMFLLEYVHAKSLICSILNRECSENFEMGEIELSVISEVGNILNSSYLNALATLIEEPISVSIPYVSIDMAAAILSVPAIEFGKVSDKALFIKNMFGPKDINITGYFLFVPDADSFKHVFSKLGVGL
ncbi:MAG: chemotaxis protein CheC [Defluviitaleaceae bacterium]|nr:chemotaxis protein CheC [Defluviitaleaceae bacterium]